MQDSSRDVQLGGRYMGVHTALGALLSREASFDGVWISGLEVSASRVVPDTEIVSLSETLEVCRQVTSACPGLPVLVDADTGYGDAVNFAYAAREFGRAGATAVCIEDKAFPKRNSFVGAHHELADIDDFAQKIRSAKDAGSPKIIARTEAIVVGAGVDAALERAGAYAAAGADAILVHDKSTSGAEAIEFAHRWRAPVPLFAVPTTYSHWRYNDLREAGFTAVIYANQGLRAAVRAMQVAMSSIISNNGTAPVESSIAPVSEIFRLQSCCSIASGTPSLVEAVTRPASGIL